MSVTAHIRKHGVASHLRCTSCKLTENNYRLINSQFYIIDFLRANIFVALDKYFPSARTILQAFIRVTYAYTHTQEIYIAYTLT
jgi:hypothetical protein